MHRNPYSLLHVKKAYKNALGKYKYVLKLVHGMPLGGNYLRMKLKLDRRTAKRLCGQTENWHLLKGSIIRLSFHYVRGHGKNEEKQKRDEKDATKNRFPKHLKKKVEKALKKAA